MFHLVILIACAFLVQPVANVQAKVFERDWMQAGDGLFTIDDVNSREWLDLTLTRGASLEDTLVALSPEGDYAGFTIASVADVEALATSAGVDVTTINEHNGPPAMSLVRLLGITADNGFGFQDSLGVSSGVAPDEFVTIGVRWSPLSEPDRGGWIEAAEGFHKLPQDRGIWLVRSVPEPTSVLLLFTGLIGTLLKTPLAARSAPWSNTTNGVFTADEALTGKLPYGPSTILHR